MSFVRGSRLLPDGFKMGINASSGSSGQIFTNLIFNTRGFAPTSDPFLNSGLQCATNSTDGWPTENFCVYIDNLELLNGSETLKCGFVGQATLTLFNSTGYAITNQSYNAGTNTTTFDITTNTGSPTSFGVEFTATKRLSGDSPGTGVTELQILYPGYTYPTEEYFTQIAVDFESPFTHKRWMDLLGVNNNINETTWDNRRTATNTRTMQYQVTLAEKQIPWEYIIEWHNRTQQDCWINIPFGAPDDVMLGVAQQFLNGRVGSWKIYLELGNEDWNTAFTHFSYQMVKASIEVEGFVGLLAGRNIVSITGNGSTTTIVTDPAHGYTTGNTIYQTGITGVAASASATVANTTTFTVPGTLNGSQTVTSSIWFYKTPGELLSNPASTNIYAARQRWHTRRTVQMSNIWRDVWGPSGMMTTIRPVLGYQSAGGTNGYFRTEFIDAAFPNKSAHYIYALAAAPYFNLNATPYGGSNIQTTPDVTEQQIIDALALTGGNIHLSNASGSAYDFDSTVYYARSRGLKAITYEAGPDTFGDSGSTTNAAKSAANFNAQMTDICEGVLNNWYAYGGVAMTWYHGGIQLATSTSQFGCWAIAQNREDTNSAKFQAFKSILASKPVASRNPVPAVIDGRAIGKVEPYSGGYYTFSSFITAEIGYVVTAASAGTLSLVIAYVATGTHSFLVKVNGTTAATVNVTNTSGEDANSSTISVPLVAGINAIGLMTAGPAIGSGVTIKSLTFT